MRFYLLFISVIFVFCAQAQHPSYTIFGEDQFKGVDIYDIIQDQKKQYYFATDRGIFLYDGYKYQKISCDEMKGASMFQFVKDSRGIIYCYNLHQQIFKIEDGSIALLYEIPDEMQHHNLWLVVDKDDNLLIQAKGIIRISKDGSQIKTIAKSVFKNRASPDSFHRLSDGSTISIAVKGIIAHQKNGSVVTRNSSLTPLYWVSLNDKTYAVDKETMHVYRFNPKQLSFTFIRKLDNVHSTSGIRLYATEDRIWLVGNSNGLYVFNENFSPLFGGKEIYTDRFISCVNTDHENNVLLGTFDEGVLLIPNNNVLGVRLKNNEKITQIISDSKSIIFLGTDQGNIYSLDNQGIRHVYSDPQRKGLEFLDFWAGQNLIVHSFGEGMQLSRFENGNLYSVSQHLGSIKNIFFANDTIAYGAFNYGIEKISNRKNHFNYIRIPSLSQRAYCVVQDINTETIFAGLSNGLVLQRKGGQPEPLLYKGKVVYPNSLIAYDGKVYIGTRKHGILIYKDDKLIHQIPFEKTIRKMLIYRDHLFILSLEGLHFGSLATLTFQKLNNSTGLNCHHISEFHAVNNTLYITNSEDLEYISLDDLFIESRKLPVQFSQILVNNEPAISNRFSSDQRRVEFQFKVSTIRYRDNVKYRYKLMGYEENWHYLDYEDNHVTYNALPPGKYKFVIQSINGNAKSLPISYSFVIATPFHDQWWFYVLIIIVSGLIITSLYSLRIRKIRKKNREKLEKQRIQTDLLETELKALRSQMNPHFIFNSLNSIQDLILREDTDASYDYIVLFASLVRSALNYSNKDFIPIEKEIEFLNVYLSLEKLRFKDDFTYEINYEGSDEIDVPSMLIQPFIENALLHGLLHKTGEKHLKINFKFDSELICIIEDNGIGRKKAREIRDRQGHKHESFALEAIDKRLKIFNEKNGSESGKYTIEDIWPEKENTGTRVIIHLPFRRHY